MKSKITLLLITLLTCCLLTGCGSAFAKAEYDNNKKIATGGDRYSKVSSVFNPIEGGNSFRVSKFNGRETLRTETVDEEREMEVLVRFSLKEGRGKVVFVDGDDNVSVLAEKSGEDGSEAADGGKGGEDGSWGAMEPISCRLVLKKGFNRIKFVGYDCKDVELELLYPETI